MMVRGAVDSHTWGLGCIHALDRRSLLCGLQTNRIKDIDVASIMNSSMNTFVKSQITHTMAVVELLRCNLAADGGLGGCADISYDYSHNHVSDTCPTLWRSAGQEQTCFGDGIMVLMASKMTQRSGREVTMTDSCR